MIMRNYNEEIHDNPLADYGAEDWFDNLVDPVKQELTINGRLALEDISDATYFTTARIRKNLQHSDVEKYPRLYDFIKLAYCAGYKIKLVPLEDE